MQDKYTIPKETRIGHVHLKVSNIEQSLDFYCDILGFDLITRYGTDAAFISAGGYHHHIGLNTWFSKNSSPPPRNTTGLFHIAILYPTRKDLATILNRLLENNIKITGASDHGVSEAIYLNDPDGNGIELYWDRPKELWQRKENGEIEMFTDRLDIDDLLNDIQ